MDIIRNFQFVKTITSKPEGIQLIKRIGVFIVYENTNTANEYFVFNPKNELYYILNRVADFDSVENDFMGAIMAFCK